LELEEEGPPGNLSDSTLDVSSGPNGRDQASTLNYNWTTGHDWINEDFTTWTLERTSHQKTTLETKTGEDAASGHWTLKTTQERKAEEDATSGDWTLKTTRDPKTGLKMAMSMDAGMAKSGRKRHHRAAEDHRAKYTALCFREGLRPRDANNERLDEATVGSLQYMKETYTELAPDGQLLKKVRICFFYPVNNPPGATPVFSRRHYKRAAASTPTPTP